MAKDVGTALVCFVSGAVVLAAAVAALALLAVSNVGHRIGSDASDLIGSIGSDRRVDHIPIHLCRPLILTGFAAKLRKLGKMINSLQRQGYSQL